MNTHLTLCMSAAAFTQATVYSGNGFTVSASGQQLQYTIQITPSTSKEHRCVGLLGNLNGDPTDDLTMNNGTVLNYTTATAQDIFSFGQSCASNTCISYR